MKQDDQDLRSTLPQPCVRNSFEKGTFIANPGQLVDLQARTQGKSEDNKALLILIMVLKQLQLCLGSRRRVPGGQSSFRVLHFLMPPLGGWDRVKKYEDGQGQRERLPLLGLGGNRSPPEDPGSASWLACGLFRTRLKEAEISQGFTNASCKRAPFCLKSCFLVESSASLGR